MKAPNIKVQDTTKKLAVDIHLTCPVSELFPLLVGLNTYLGMSFKDALRVYVPDQNTRDAVLAVLVAQDLLDEQFQPQIGVVSRIQTRWKSSPSAPLLHSDVGRSLKTLADQFRAAVQRIQRSSGKDQPYVDLQNPIAFLRKLIRQYRYEDIEKAVDPFCQSEGIKRQPMLTWLNFAKFLEGHIPIDRRKALKSLLHPTKLKRLSP